MGTRLQCSYNTDFVPNFQFETESDPQNSICVNEVGITGVILDSIGF
jgi:hypothetical protein